jgi:hypothetical protein
MTSRARLRRYCYSRQAMQCRITPIGLIRPTVPFALSTIVCYPCATFHWPTSGERREQQQKQSALRQLAEFVAHSSPHPAQAKRAGAGRAPMHARLVSKSSCRGWPVGISGGRRRRKLRLGHGQKFALRLVKRTAPMQNEHRAVKRTRGR